MPPVAFTCSLAINLILCFQGVHRLFTAYIITGSAVLFDQLVASIHPALNKEVTLHDGKKWGIIQGGVGLNPTYRHLCTVQGL